MILRNSNGTFASKSKIYKWLVIVFIIVIGLLIGANLLIGWGATHQLQKPWIYVPAQLSFRRFYKDIEPKVISPVVVVENDFLAELEPVEKKIVEKWGYKDGVVALAIFDCGESGLNQFAVSPTGDLGIAQINWYWNGKIITERLGYTTADLLSDVDKNLEAAYLIWDRADGTEGNGEGNWTPWSGFNNGGYLRCLK